MCNRYRIEVEFDELWHAARPHRDMTNRAKPSTEVISRQARACHPQYR